MWTALCHGALNTASTNQQLWDLSIYEGGTTSSLRSLRVVSAQEGAVGQDEEAVSEDRPV